MAIRRRAWLLALLGLALAPRGELRAQVAVTIQWLYPIETLYLADLSPYTTGSQPEFLSIHLLNGANQQNVRLEVSLTMEQPTAAAIFKGTTDPFQLTGTSRRLTNRDLACSSCPYGIEDGEVESAWEDLLAETGRFPSGTYRVLVRVLNATGTELDRDEVHVTLVNPSRIELVSPGTRYGETPEVVTNSTPRFLWSSDAGVVAGGGVYRIRVVPVDGAASPEDAIEQYASWEATTPATTAIYPGSAAAIPLVPGGTYAWQIVREVRGSTGTELISSPIYWFRMSEAATGDDASNQGRGGGTGAGGQLQELARVLGIDLSGFRPSGQIYVDGQLYPIEKLEELLRAILAGEISVQSITVQ
jgi:hypothetical protein